MLLDLGSHLVDQAIVLFGAVDRVYAELESHRGGADDDAFLALEHRSVLDIETRGMVLADDGTEIETAAEREGVTPRELADRNAAKFEALMPIIDSSNDFFIRT